MIPPPFPKESLYGAFPSFPVGYAQIPDILDLPSYIYSVTTYYGNPFNYPYSNPPLIASWDIPYPNIFQIPSFFENVILWVLGWLGAVFEWSFQWLSAEGTNSAIWAINGMSAIVQSLTATSEEIAQSTGIFEPLIFALLAGMILFAVVGVVFILINLGEKIA